ncbi:MAG: Hsp33 family molecular chaperone HslO [Alphaproteobacteria bacterium]
MTEKTQDYVRPFILRQGGVRGRFAVLDQTVDTILRKQNYPEAIARLVGEAIVVCALVANGFKLRHRFSIQLKTDGELRLLMAEFTAGGEMRAYASFDDAARSYSAEQAYNLVGRGTMAMIIDNGPGSEPYQGIVPLTGGDFAESVEFYFNQSDQIDTVIRLGVAQQQEPETKYLARGVLLQNLPAEGGLAVGDDEDAFVTAQALLHTLKDVELYDEGLNANQLLYNLFHEMEVAVLDDQQVHFGCSCTRERIGVAICVYDQEGVENLPPQEMIAADCQFCGEQYVFSGAELKILQEENQS